jgi:uncharacterized protein (DUF1778 family)
LVHAPLEQEKPGQESQAAEGPPVLKSGVSITPHPFARQFRFLLTRQASVPVPAYIKMESVPMPRQANHTVEARISPEALAVLQRAADIQGRSVSEFMVDAAQQRAQKTIEETTSTRSAADHHRRITEPLLDPPEPMQALRRGFAVHRQLFGEI